MKVVHINTYARYGAATAALRLHKGLLNLGIDSTFLSLEQSEKYPKVHVISRNISFTARVLNRLGFPRTIEQKNASKIKAGGDFEVFTFPNSSIDLSSHPLVKSADIIHLHWVSDFLDYSSFFRQCKKPIVWTLHDMNPFQGGFHYKADEERNASNYLGKLDQKIKKQKKQVLKLCNNIHVIGPSKWLMDASKQSEAFNKFSHASIFYGLDTQIFFPYDIAMSRSVFKLPQDRRLLLFVSDNILNKRKGFDILTKAIEHLIVPDDVVFCSVGDLRHNLSSDRIIHLGRITDERLMPLLYSAMDAVIIPSREDNLPNVMIEALACGLPVIGFPVGGIQEVLKNPGLGILADDISEASLAKAIDLFLNDPTLFDKQSIREFAEQNFNLTTQAEKYLALYNVVKHEI